jgi:hypothetical protein
VVDNRYEVWGAFDNHYWPALYFIDAEGIIRDSHFGEGRYEQSELPSPGETVTVWRCQDCGGIDAPQPCIDVYIWDPADWVDLAPYDSEQSRAAVDREVERSLAGLLRRYAFTTPRNGQWEPSWRAFQSRARLAFPSGKLRGVANERAIRQAQADG